MKIEDDAGNEIEVFTAAEVAEQKAALEATHKAALEDKEQHVKKKLEEFQTGKTAAELKEKEWESKIEAATRIAEEAKAHGQTESQKRIDELKSYTMEQYGGADPEIKKKLEDAYAIINKDTATDADVVERVRLAAAMSGLTGGVSTVNPGIYGGYAPSVKSANEQGAAADYDKFTDALGLSDFIKPKQ